MKSKNIAFEAAMIFLAATPLIYLWSIWQRMPGIITISYPQFWQPVVEKEKTALVYIALGMFLAATFIFILLRRLRHVDPKVRQDQSRRNFNHLSVALLIFFTVLNFVVIRTALVNTDGNTQRLAFILFALLIVILGNYMNSLKPNYFVGLRLPWTLNDKDNWRKTHQLAGKLWFWAGLALLVVFLLIPGEAMKVVFIVCIGLIVIIPSIFSYRLYKIKKG